MKTSAVLASALLAALAVAAPVNRRDLVTRTEVVTETVIVYTTVYEDDIVPQATTTPAGYFYEQPQVSSSVAAQPTSSSAPAYSPPAEEAKPSSTYVAPAPAPTSATPEPAPVESAYVAPAPASVAPAPVESVYVAPAAAPVAPAPVASSAAPAPAPAPAAPQTGGSTTGQSYSNVDMTIYDNNGGFGACGTKLYDTDMVVALAKGTWGESTYDVMTGESTNPWCGQKIQVQYGDNAPIVATIMDMCPGCTGGNDIDLSLAAWKAATGLDEKTRVKATWSKIS